MADEDGREKTPVAASIAERWAVAVFQSSLPHSISIQSMKPVVAVSAVEQRPTTSAIHQAYAAFRSTRFVTSRIAAIVANVYVPIVTSVRGG